MNLQSIFNGSTLHLLNTTNQSRINIDLYLDNYLFASFTLTIFVACLTCLISLVTIIGNVFVITAFIIDKTLRTYSNYLILNLSLADLCIGILMLPYIPFLLNNYTWSFGRIACVTWLVFDYVVGSASVLCIVAISLDRFLLVSRGLGYLSKQRRNKTLFIMFSVWGIAFLNYGPAIIIWDILDENRDSKTCHVGFHENLGYLTISACVEFFFPLISICSLNIAVYLNIRKRSKGLILNVKSLKEVSTTNNKKIKEMANLIRRSNYDSEKTMISQPNKTALEMDTHLPVTRKITLTPDLIESNMTLSNKQGKKSIFKRMSSSMTEDPSQLNLTQYKATSLQKDRKAARFLFIIVFVFGVCWAPYTFLALMSSVYKDCVNENLFEVSFWLLWFNSTLNPILYPFLHVKFRKAFIKIFTNIKQFVLKCLCLRYH